MFQFQHFLCHFLVQDLPVSHLILIVLFSVLVSFSIVPFFAFASSNLILASRSREDEEVPLLCLDDADLLLRLDDDDSVVVLSSSESSRLRPAKLGIACSSRTSPVWLFPINPAQVMKDNQQAIQVRCQYSQ